MLKYSLPLFFSISVLLLVPASVSASPLSAPQFPSCTNPQGTLVVHYPSGIHGIVGDSGQYSGSDSVYRASSELVYQCFCPVDSNSGIQTNWWQVEDPSSESIASFVKLGWIYVPSGSAWGLADGAYLAKNLNFDCRPTSTPPGGQSTGGDPSGPFPAPVCTDTTPPAPILLSVDRRPTSATLTWTAVTPVTHYTIAYGLHEGDYIYGVPNTGNVTSFTVGSLNPGQEYFFSVRAVNTCAPSSPSTGGVGGAVLGLAATGNWSRILILLSLSLFGLVLTRLSIRRENV